MKLPKFVQPHTVAIEEYEGAGAYGPTFADSYDCQGYFQQERKYVRGDEGDEIVSSCQFFTSDNIDPPGQSKVTFDGKEYIVISSSPKTSAIGGKHSHTEVYME